MSRPLKPKNGTAESRLTSLPEILDPTANVIALTEAANRRQDDLREADERYVQARLKHLSQLIKLRGDHTKEMRKSEAERLDKIRQVDVLAGTTAAAAAATAIQALAATTDRNAENLRNQLNATAAANAKQLTDTAATIAAQTDNLVKGINERISSLEKASYQGAGKSSVVDPQMSEFVTEMRALVKSNSQATGKGEGVSTTVVVVGGVFMGFLNLVAIGVAIWAVLHK